MMRGPMTEPTPAVSFDSLGLSEPVLAAVRAVGYESPSPIQQAAIPPLLEGRDVLGQAQTGTGKTAAFALPLLCRIDVARAEPQLLVLTPTRELAIQVAEAMQTYARNLKGFHVLPVYGGTGMDFQLKQLRRGVHAVVGTPGRIECRHGRGASSARARMELHRLGDLKSAARRTGTATAVQRARRTRQRERLPSGAWPLAGSATAADGARARGGEGAAGWNSCRAAHRPVRRPFHLDEVSRQQRACS